MIWHAHVPLEPEDREYARQHLVRVIERVRCGGSLAKILRAKTCVEGLRKINDWLVPLMRHAPESKLGMLEGIRTVLTEHVMGEFALGIDRGMLHVTQLGTLQRGVAMWPKNRHRRAVG